MVQISSASQARTYPSSPAVISCTRCCCSRISSRIMTLRKCMEFIAPSWHVISSSIQNLVSINPPLHANIAPDPVPLKVIFPSPDSHVAQTSDNGSAPNFPSDPCNFNPVKVSAIFQNLTWPVPHVVNCPYTVSENDKPKTSCENALQRKMDDSFSQSQIVNK